MSARRALVTGAGGFVGAVLVRRLLAAGHHVEALVRPQSDRWRLTPLGGDLAVRETDLRDADTVARCVQTARPDWVFHLAAHGAYSWQTSAHDIFASNLLGTLHLTEACVEHGFEAFIHAGSSSEYGHKDHAPAEHEMPEPDSDYAVAKASATMLCSHLARRHGLWLCTLRLYSVYGPWEDPRRLMPTLVAHGLRGELPPLVDPDTARDFVHVEDVCEAFLAVARRTAPGSNGIYNVGSGGQTTVGQAVSAVREVLGVDAEPRWGTFAPRAWDTRVWVSNPAKIRRELGWRPTRDLHTGIRETAAWMTEHPALWPRYGISDAASPRAPGR